MIENNIDFLVLGCTHYPLLIPTLKTLLPNNVRIIHSGLAVARQTKTILKSLNLLNSSDLYVNDEFYVNSKRRVIQSFLPKDSKIIYLK